MAKLKVSGSASGTGTITLIAPSTSTDRTITLPDESITLGGGVDGIVSTADATAITIDSSENVGIGVVPPTDTLSTILSVNGANIMGNSTSGSYLGNNVYYNGGWKRQFTSGTSLISHTNSGDITFRAAASGAADSAITFTTPLEIKADGRGLSQFTAKAWCQIDFSNSSINDSHNISSVTDNGTGDQSINFTNNMANTYFSAVATAGGASWNNAVTHWQNTSTAYTRVGVLDHDASQYVDDPRFSLVVFGD